MRTVIFEVNVAAWAARMCVIAVPAVVLATALTTSNLHAQVDESGEAEVAEETTSVELSRDRQGDRLRDRARSSRERDERTRDAESLSRESRSRGGYLASRPTLTPEEQKLPQRGVISSATQGGAGESIDLWGDQDITSGQKNPLSGSVFKLQDGKWGLRLVNNSTGAAYSGTVKIEQLDTLGQVVKGDSFSFSLAPGQTIERSAYGVSTVKNARLVLESWQKVGATDEHIRGRSR